MSITIADNLSKTELSPFMDKAKKEGVHFVVGATYSKWSCTTSTVSVPKIRGCNPLLSFCHEWGHARLYLEGRSPVHNRTVWVEAKDVCTLEGDQKREAILTILNEEVMAWNEVPTMTRLEPWMNKFIINCFSTYLDAFEVKGERREYWLNKLPLA